MTNPCALLRVCCVTMLECWVLFLNGAAEVLLPPGLVQDNGHGIGQVEASLPIHHFESQQMRVIELFSDLGR